MSDARDWTGNSRSAHATLGARNYAQNERETNAVTYAWFIWEKGFQGEPIVRWFN